jgi:hypothetical protein
MARHGAGPEKSATKQKHSPCACPPTWHVSSGLTMPALNTSVDLVSVDGALTGSVPPAHQHGEVLHILKQLEPHFRPLLRTQLPHLNKKRRLP